MEACKSDTTVEKDDRLDLALSLVDAIERDDQEFVDKTICKLAHSYESSLFNEIGQLTRHVHDALGFCSDHSRISEIANNEIHDARDRLQYVIEKTEISANRTLDIAEDLLKGTGVLASEADNLKNEWQRFTSREMNVTEFCTLSRQLERFLEKIGQDTGKFHDDISDLMVAQDFQDLTGQVIKQVIDLIQEVESKLVILVRNAGPKTTAIIQPVKDIEAEGPQISASDNENVVNNQEDVDSLLSSLGF